MNNSCQKKIKLITKVRSFLNFWKVDKLPIFTVNQFEIGYERWLVIDLVNFNKIDLASSHLFNPIISKLFQLCMVDPNCYLFWFSDYEEMFHAFDWPIETNAFLIIVLIG